MTLIHCSECKGKLSDKALMCPHCGFVMPKKLGNNSLAQKPRTMHQEIIDESNIQPAEDKKRAHKRINIKMMAKINRETARLCNVSKGGMKLATPISHNDPNIDITLNNGEKVVNVKGIIRWVSSKRSFSNILDIGVEISEAPQEYYVFIDQLLAQH